MDKTGPSGKGPRTGKGLGICNTKNAKAIPGLGQRNGQGRKLGGRFLKK